MSGGPNTSHREFHAAIREVEPGVFRAECGELNPTTGLAGTSRLSSGLSVADVKIWVEQMARSMGYDQDHRLHRAIAVAGEINERDDTAATATDAPARAGKQRHRSPISDGELPLREQIARQGCADIGRRIRELAVPWQ